MKKKLLAGDGWSFEPAGRKKEGQERLSLPPAEQRPKLTVEKRPKGKVVTVLSNVELSDADRKALAKELKNACGSGGADKDNHIEIQGSHRETILSLLIAKGWRIK